MQPTMAMPKGVGAHLSWHTTMRRKSTEILQKRPVCMG